MKEWERNLAGLLERAKWECEIARRGESTDMPWYLLAKVVLHFN